MFVSQQLEFGTESGVLGPIPSCATDSLCESPYRDVLRFNYSAQSPLRAVDEPQLDYKALIRIIALLFSQNKLIDGL